MPSLQILKGANEGENIPLEGDKFVLGRDPDCDIVIARNNSVSRKHAQIIRIANRYFIEDNKSRNHTFVNNVLVTTRLPLKNNDRILICDFLATFVDPRETTMNGNGDYIDDRSEDGEGSSTVEAAMSQTSQQLLESQPAEKLRGLLEISANLSRTLELDQLLPKIADSLFLLFRQADRCFLIQTSEEMPGRMMPRVVRTRKPHEEANARYSRSIVRRCLETAQAFLSDDASRDDRIQLSQSVVDFKIRSVMCVPLVGLNGKAFGVIQLDTQDRSKKFTQEDLKLLWGVANQAAVALENARLHEETVSRERVKRDLELAHQVQLSFLPQRLPVVAGYEFWGHYEPAQEVGGDYYGFIPLPGGRLAIALGDVAGKGIPAALLMAKLSSDTRFSLLTEPTPALSIRELNDLLCEFAVQADRFVTLALAVLDPSTHTVTLVNAGHPSPLLCRHNPFGLHDAVPAKTAGMPLGILEGVDYDSCEVTLGPGDSLLLYSDGVSEAPDAKSVAFGIKGIHDTLQQAAPCSPRSLVERLALAVESHAAGRDQHDDITLVCLGRTT
jgi:serine phosphatase RsbU (regulator of sigma subunit)